MLAIRYRASLLTSGISGREAFLSDAVWCFDHKVSFEDVISIEKDVAENLGEDMTDMTPALISANACWRSASLVAYPGRGCATVGSWHLALTAATNNIGKSGFIILARYCRNPSVESKTERRGESYRYGKYPRPAELLPVGSGNNDFGQLSIQSTTTSLAHSVVQ